MKSNFYCSDHLDCKTCTKKTDRCFKYTETLKGEKYVFDTPNNHTIIFILSGEALVTCNNFIDVHFHENEIVILPINSSSSWKSLSNTSTIVLTCDSDISPCDNLTLKEYAQLWLTSTPRFKGLLIKSRIAEFLASVKNYLKDGITCPYMHKTKQHELTTLFRAYYSQKELIEFFLPIVRSSHEFEHFIMSNYLHIRGVKEFVNLSGMNLSTFNRKFKAHFKESPYQWLIKQKSKHIYYELLATNKSLSSIAQEYHFVDASHFNRYCKSMFGDSPSILRKRGLEKNMETTNPG